MEERKSVVRYLPIVAMVALLISNVYLFCQVGYYREQANKVPEVSTSVDGGGGNFSPIKPDGPYLALIDLDGRFETQYWSLEGIVLDDVMNITVEYRFRWEIIYPEDDSEVPRA